MTAGRPHPRPCAAVCAWVRVRVPPPWRRRACACRFQVLDLYSTRSLGAGAQCMLFYPGPRPPTPLCTLRTHPGETKGEKKRPIFVCECVCGFEFFVHAYAGRGRGIVQAYNTVLLQYKRGAGNHDRRGRLGNKPAGPPGGSSRQPPSHPSLPFPPQLGSVSGNWEGDPRVPGGKGLSWAPGLIYPNPTSPTTQGSGASALLAQYSQPEGPGTPPLPPRKPLQVGGGVDGASAKEADVGP